MPLNLQEIVYPFAARRQEDEARATLDMHDSLRERYQEQWKEAAHMLSGHWKIMHNLPRQRLHGACFIKLGRDASSSFHVQPSSLVAPQRLARARSFDDARGGYSRRLLDIVALTL